MKTFFKHFYGQIKFPPQLHAICKYFSNNKEWKSFVKLFALDFISAKKGKKNKASLKMKPMKRRWKSFYFWSFTFVENLHENQAANLFLKSFLSFCDVYGWFFCWKWKLQAKQFNIFWGWKNLLLIYNLRKFVEEIIGEKAFYYANLLGHFRSFVCLSNIQTTHETIS